MEKNKINNGLVFLYIIVLLPFLRINRINEIIGSSGLKLYMIISALVLFVVFLLSVGKVRVTKTFYSFLLYQGIIVLSTLFFRGFEWGIMLVLVVTVLVFVLSLVHLREIMSAVCIVLVPAIIINFFTVIFATGEFNEIFFLGGKNAVGMVVVPASFILFLNSLHSKGKISFASIAVAIIGIVSTIMAGSATGIVVSVITIFFLIYFVNVIPKKVFWFWSVVFAYLLFLIFSDGFFKSEIWNSFVEMLGKDATLTSRTRIWTAVLELIKTNPLFGYGRGIEFSYTGASYFGAAQFETHNVALQVLLDGGICAMVFYLLFLYNIIKQLNMNDVKHRLIFAAIIVLLINGLTEAIANSMYMMIIFSIANVYATQESLSNNTD